MGNKKQPPKVDLYDNTRIESHCKCERMDYFRHERHLVPLKPSKALEFGSAWHCAMDAVWSAVCFKKSKNDKKVAELGIEVFMAYWQDKGFPGPSEWTEIGDEERAGLEPNTPMVAMEMIYEYVKARRGFMEGVELLEVEMPCVAPIYHDRSDVMYGGRIDKVFRRNSRIYGLDHKTTSMYSKFGVFRDIYLEGFSPNRQLDGYLHALKMKYGKEAKAVWADCALVHKSIHDGFRFVPVEMQTGHLDAWLWETRQRIDSIRSNRALLVEYRVENKSAHSAPSFLPAFPKKTEACTLYGKKCDYMDLCRMWSNPEQHPDVPPGFKEEEWSPFTEDMLREMGVKK